MVPYSKEMNFQCHSIVSRQKKVTTSPVDTRRHFNVCKMSIRDRRRRIDVL